MGVYIKGMTMPTSCSECGQFRWNNFLQSDVCRIAEAIRNDGIFQSENEGIGNRPSWCPLVPIPPHGRLIDAEEFLHRAIGTKCFRVDYALMLEELVGESTTIISAEEGET